MFVSGVYANVNLEEETIKSFTLLSTLEENCLLLNAFSDFQKKEDGSTKYVVRFALGHPFEESIHEITPQQAKEMYLLLAEQAELKMESYQHSAKHIDIKL